MSLHRVQIYYFLCPELKTNLVEFPATATISNQNKLVHGRCAQHAKFIGRKRPEAHCTLGGNWVITGNQCTCLDGYFHFESANSEGSCEPCPAETYRNGGMRNCAPCPKNRESDEGQASCKCKLGYRQLSESNTGKQCYKPAMQAKVIGLDVYGSYAQFSVRPPSEESEKYQLRYLITVCETTVQGVDEPFECVWKNKEIRFKRENRPLKVSNLKPRRKYEVTIVAENSVSRLDDENTLFFDFITPQEVPEKVLGLSAVQNQADKRIISLKWERPGNSGFIENYNVLYQTSGEEVKSVNVSATEMNITDIKTGTDYFISVAAGNQAGYSVYEEVKLAIPVDDEFPLAVYLVAAASGILIVISLIVCAYCCCCRPVPRKKIPNSGTSDTILNGKVKF